MGSGRARFIGYYYYYNIANWSDRLLAHSQLNGPRLLVLLHFTPNRSFIGSINYSIIIDSDTEEAELFVHQSCCTPGGSIILISKQTERIIPSKINTLWTLWITTSLFNRMDGCSPTKRLRRWQTREGDTAYSNLRKYREQLVGSHHGLRWSDKSMGKGQSSGREVKGRRA